MLTELPQTFVKDDSLKLRQACLEVLQRAGSLDAVKAHVPSILNACMSLLQTGDEVVGTAIVRVVLDLHKAHRDPASQHTGAFLAFAAGCYGALPAAAGIVFQQAGLPAPQAGLSAMGVTGENAAALAAGERLLPATASFRVATELPIVVIYLLQFQRQPSNTVVQQLVPLMMRSLQVSPQGTGAGAHQRHVELVQAQVKCVSFITYLLRGESHKLLEPHKDLLGNAIVRLLASCPPAPAGTNLRREVLVATRHFLRSPLKSMLEGHVDAMLQESLLIGKTAGGQPASALRPLAILLLVDLLQEVRKSLSLAQLSIVITLFSRYTHDPALPTAIQSASVRLLLNLVDSIYHNEAADISIGRSLLARILSTLVQKFGALQAYIPHIILAARRQMCSRLANRRIKAEQLAHTTLLGAVSRGEVAPADAPALQQAAKTRAKVHRGTSTTAVRGEPGREDGFTEFGDGVTERDQALLQRFHGYDPLVAGMTSSDSGSQRTHRAHVDAMACVKDVKVLMKFMTLGLKTLVWCISNYKRSPQGSHGGAAYDTSKLVQPGGGGMLTEGELDLISKFLKWGLRCLMIFTHLPPHTDWEGKPALPAAAAQGAEAQRRGRRTPPSTSSQSLWTDTAEQTEMTNFFAGIFTILDSHNFRDLMNAHMPLLFRYLLGYPSLLTIAQHLLANERAARPFADLVLQYLVRHIHLLNADSPAVVAEPVHIAAAAALRSATRFALGDADDGAEEGGACDTFGPVVVGSMTPPAYAEAPPLRTEKSLPSIAAARGGEAAALVRGYTFTAAGEGPEASPLPWRPAPERISPADFAQCLADPLAPCISPATPLVLFAPEVRSAVLTRLFRITMASITHLFMKHEPILRPYVATIVLGVLRDTLHTSNPTNHLLLLKALFKSVSKSDSTSSKSLDQLYKEFPPLLAALLHHLLALHDSTSDPTIRDTCIELCLIVPARLTAQLPHLRRFVRPVILGLRSRDSTLQAQALKTFEFWIDNLNPEYLYPLLSAGGHVQDFMGSLVALLRPAPSKFGDLALRLLGKLGGNNRLFLLAPPTMPHIATPAPGVQLMLQWKGTSATVAASPPTSEEDADVDLALPGEDSGAAGAAQRAIALLRAQGAMPDQAAGQALAQRAASLPSVTLPFDDLSALAFRILNRHFEPRGAVRSGAIAASANVSDGEWPAGQDERQGVEGSALEEEIARIMADEWGDEEEEQAWVTSGLPQPGALSKSQAASHSSSRGAKDGSTADVAPDIAPVQRCAPSQCGRPAAKRCVKQHAWALLRNALQGLLGKHAGALGSPAAIESIAAEAVAAHDTPVSPPGEQSPQGQVGAEAGEKHIAADAAAAQTASVRRLLLALALAAGDAALQEGAQGMLHGLVRHLTLLAVAKHTAEVRRSANKAVPRLPYIASALPTGTGASVLAGTTFNPLILTDVIMTLVSGQEQKALLPVAVGMLGVMLHTLKHLRRLGQAAGMAEGARYPGWFLVDDLLEQITHAAYVRAHHPQLGACCLGIALTKLLSHSQLTRRMPALTRAMVHVLRDVARQHSASTLLAARVALDMMWRSVYLPCARVPWASLKSTLPEGTVLLKVPLALPGLRPHPQASRAMRCQLMPHASADPAAEVAMPAKGLPNISQIDKYSAVAVLAVAVTPPGTTAGEEGGAGDSLGRMKALGLFMGPAGKSVLASSPDQARQWLLAATRAADASGAPADGDEGSDGDVQLEGRRSRRGSAKPDLSISVPGGDSGVKDPLQADGVALLALAQPCGSLANFSVYEVPLLQPVPEDVPAVRRAARAHVNAGGKGGVPPDTPDDGVDPEQVLPSHTSSVLPVLPMSPAMDQADRQVLEAVAKGMAAREGPARHACMALANRIAMCKGTDLSSMLAPWAGSFASIVYQHSFRRLSPLQQVGQLHMMAYLCRHAPGVLPVDERALVMLSDALALTSSAPLVEQLREPAPTSYKGRSEAKKVGAIEGEPEFDADPEAGHALRMQVSPVPYLWPDPMELGWPHFGVRGDLRIQYAHAYSPHRATSHSRGALGAPRAMCTSSVGPTCTAECVLPELSARDEQLPSWCARLNRLATRARQSDVLDPTPTVAGVGLDSVLASPHTLGSACSPAFGDVFGQAPAQPVLVPLKDSLHSKTAQSAAEASWPTLGFATFESELLDGGVTGLLTRGVACIFPGAVGSSIAPSAIFTPLTKYALTAAVTGTPTVDYTPPNFAVILRCAVAELIQALVDANPFRMLREGAPTPAPKPEGEDGDAGAAAPAMLPGKPIGRLPPDWLAKLRSRFYRVLLQSQFAPHPGVVAACHAAFARIMSHPTFQRGLLREMLQGSDGLLRSQLQQLSTDKPRFSTATLRGMGAMFTLLSDYFNESLADTVLERLAKWRQPKEVQEGRVAPRGREVDVAALLFNLLHLLPCRKGSSVPQRVIALWRDIASLLYRYRTYGPLSSPLLEPVARLLEGYAQETVKFFLDPKNHHLSRGLVANMLIALVRHPNSVSIRRLLSSDWGATVICKHLLQVKPKSRPTGDAAGTVSTPGSGTSPAFLQTASGPAVDTPTGEQGGATAEPGGGDDGSGDDDASIRRSSRRRKATPAAIASAEQAETQTPTGTELPAPSPPVTADAATLGLADTPTPLAPLANPGSIPDEAAAKQERAKERAQELQYQGLRLVRLLSKTEPQLLLRNRAEVVKQVLCMWRDTTRRARLAADSQHFVRNAHEVRLMAKILIMYLRVEPDDIDVYLHLLSAMSLGMHVDMTFVRTFLSVEVPVTISPELRVALMQRYISLHGDATVPASTKRDALHHLVLPVLAECLRDEATAVDALQQLNQLQGAGIAAAGAGSDAPPADETLEVPTPAPGTTPHVVAAPDVEDGAAPLDASPQRASTGGEAGGLLSPQLAMRTPARRGGAEKPSRGTPPSRSSGSDGGNGGGGGGDVGPAPGGVATDPRQGSTDWLLAVRSSPLKADAIKALNAGVRSGAMKAETAALFLRAREATYPISVDGAGEPTVRRVVDATLAAAFITGLMAGEAGQPGGDDEAQKELQVQVLRLAAMLISSLESTLIPLEHRKALVKFAWPLLQSKHELSRQWAYITVAKYIKMYVTPTKIILQVFVALLRDSSTTQVGLVRSALRTITPALPERLKRPDLLMALKWVKRILYDECKSPKKLVQVWRILVQHERVFYEQRAIYLPLILHSLPGLAFQSPVSTSRRELSVALVGTLLRWETRSRQAGVNSSLLAASDPPGKHPAPPDSAAHRTLSDEEAAEVGNFLLRAIFHTARPPAELHTTRRCLRLLHALLQLWPDCALRTVHITPKQSQGSTPPINSAPLSMALVRTLHIIVTCPGKARDMIPSAAGYIMYLLTPTFAMKQKGDGNEVALLHGMVRKFLAAVLERFPLALPAARMRHVRFWPWMASCLSFRLSTTVGHPMDAAREYAKTASEVAEPETQPLPARRAASAAAAGKGFAAGAQQHAHIDGVLSVPTVDSPHVAAMSEADRAAAYEGDDGLASHAWRMMRQWLAVSASEDNLLALLQLLCVLAAKSPTLIDAFASALLQLLRTLLKEHLGEAGSDSTPPAAPSGAAPLSPVAAGGNSRETASLLATRLRCLTLLLRLLGSRALVLQPVKLQQFLDLLNMAVPKSPSSQLLWECVPLIRMLLSAGGDGHPDTGVGLTQKQKLALITSMSTLGVYAAADVRGVPSSIAVRAVNLGEEYAPLQYAYLHLALEVYHGRVRERPDGTRLPSWWLPTPATPDTWPKPTAILRHMLQSTLMMGCLASDEWIRNQCLDIMIAAAQEKAVADAQEWQAAWAAHAPVGASADPITRRTRARLAEQWRELLAFAYTPCPIGRGAAASTSEEAPSTGAAKALATLLGTGWDTFASHIWLAVAVRALMRGLEPGAAGLSPADTPFPPLPSAPREAREPASPSDLAQEHGAWMAEAAGGCVDAGQVLPALSTLAHASLDVAVLLWRGLLPAAWAALTPWQRSFFLPHLSVLLCKDVHHLQIPGAAADALDVVASFRTKQTARPVAGAVPDVRWGAPLWAGPNGPAVGFGRGVAASAALAGATRDRPFAAVNRAPRVEADSGTGTAALGSWGMNIVQLLMYGVVACKPTPLLRPEVLRYVARTFGCWEMALPLLEDQALRMSAPLPPAPPAAALAADAGGKDDVPRLMAAARRLTRAMRQDATQTLAGVARHETASQTIGPIFALYDTLLVPSAPDAEACSGPQQESRIRALISLYSELGADDMAAGVRRRFAASPLSRLALTMESHGRWNVAYRVYASAMQKAASYAAESAKAAPSSTVETAAALPDGGKALSAWQVEATPAPGSQRDAAPDASRLLLQQAKKAASSGTPDAVPAAPARGRKRPRRGSRAASAAKRRAASAPSPGPPTVVKLDAALLSVKQSGSEETGAAYLPRALAGKDLSLEALLAGEGYGKAAQAPAPRGRKRPRVKQGQAGASDGLLQPQSAADEPLSDVSFLELSLWEERWVEACKQLTYWPVLKAYAEGVQDATLHADACSKLADWDTLKSLLNKPALQTAALYNERVKLYEVECAVMDFKLSSHTMSSLEGSNTSSAVSLLLKRWLMLPGGLTSYRAHERLLADAQRLREVREAIAVAHAVLNSISRAQRPDLKPVLGTWRERLPNVWEGLPVWDNILTWRHHVFNATVDRLTSHLLGDLSAEEGSDLHDATWTVIKVADTARKLDLPGVCALTLSRLMEVRSLDLNDAFAKARQQMIVALPAARQGLYSCDARVVLRGALSLLNCTDMGLFDSNQKAELLRMKGLYWWELGPGPVDVLAGTGQGGAAAPSTGQQDCWLRANEQFAAAVKVDAGWAKAWLTWGRFLHAVHDAALFPILSGLKQESDKARARRGASGVLESLPAPEGSPHAPLPESGALTGSMVLPLAQQAIVAMLLAVNHRCKDAAMQLSHVLALMDNDVEGSPLGAVLNKYGAQVPSWLWVAWVPQLLNMLMTPSADAASTIVAALTLNFPQAVYFQMHSFKLSRTEAGSKSKNTLVTKNETTLITRSGKRFKVRAGTDARALKVLMKSTSASVTADPHTEWQGPSFKVLPPPDVSGNASEEGGDAAAAAEPAPAEGGGAAEAAAPDAHARVSKLSAKLLNKFAHLETLMFYFAEAMSSRLASPGATSRALEEEMLEFVHGLLHKAAQIPPCAVQVPGKMKERVARGFAQLFPASSSRSESNRAAFERFCAAYKEPFARDLLAELPADTAKELGVEVPEGATSAVNPAFDDSVDGLISTLTKWKGRLQAVLTRSWSHLLYHYSSFLSDLHHSALEVPGQYQQASVLDALPSPKVRVAGLDPYVHVAHNPLDHKTERSITLLGDDGHAYMFAVQAAHNAATESCARRAQQAVLLNRVLGAHHDSRGRQLSLSEPTVTPISNTSRLLSLDPSGVTCGSAAAAHAAGKGRRTSPSQLFREAARRHAAEAGGDPASEEVQRQANVAGLQAVESAGCCPATALRDHIAARAPCPDVFAQIRARFSRQYGAAALMSWVVSAHSSSSHRLRVSLSSGDAQLLNTRPSFHANGSLHPCDAVQFRMTPSVQAFMTPFAIDGPFANAFIASAVALQDRVDWVQCHNMLYLRDELISWRCRGRTPPDKLFVQASGELRRVWLHNTRIMQERLISMTPPEKVDTSLIPESWFSITAFAEQKAKQAAGVGPDGNPASAPSEDTVRSLCDGQVFKLITQATSQHLRAQMPLSWEPWA